MNKLDFIHHINKLRKQNKGSWYQFTGMVEGKEIALKGFGTWLQIYRVDGVNQNTTMDNSVTQFNAELAAGVV